LAVGFINQGDERRGGIRGIGFVSGERYRDQDGVAIAGDEALGAVAVAGDRADLRKAPQVLPVIRPR